jgi:Rap1a immunity proteins
MRNLCLLLAMLMAGLPVVPAQTDEHIWDSGNSFIAVCGVDADKAVAELTDAELHATRACIPYLRGVDDGISAGTALGRAPFCPPAHVTNGQMEQVLVKYIREHPEKAHYLTAVLYLAAMEKAFPCSGKK